MSRANGKTGTATVRTLSRPADPATGLSPGDVLESCTSQMTYKVEKRLGAGSFGTVWLCRESRRGERRAVKVLPADHAQELATEVAQARRACDAAGEYYVPKLYEASEASIFGRKGPKHLLIAMEFINGTTASNMAYGTVIPAKCTRTILGDIAMALDRLHHFGIIHRDVKGDNVMVSREGFSFLCDFGISAHEEELRTRGELSPVGTPDFMAPEILARVPQFSNKVDVWAFGILAIQLSTGSTPARELRLPDAYSTMEYIAMSRPPVVPHVPGYSLAFVKAVESCLRRNPGHRASMHELLQGEWARPQGDAGYEVVASHIKDHMRMR
mmetsp:Transcript_107806/g.336208  ORF Transcript_107806/g.336208 Transcript_107806/m.336208 type:complete len:328 (+) Transcript_107806:167-1150(+)